MDLEFLCQAEIDDVVEVRRRQGISFVTAELYGVEIRKHVYDFLKSTDRKVHQFKAFSKTISSIVASATRTMSIASRCQLCM
jgi:hypothetical protein